MIFGERTPPNGLSSFLVRRFGSDADSLPNGCGERLDAMGERRSLALLLLAAAIALGMASGVSGAGRDTSATSVAAPQTLVVLTVPISQFAQDGARIAWMTGRCKTYEKPVDQVALRTVSVGRRHVLAPKVCGFAPAPSTASGLAVSGTRALFWWPVEGGNFTYHRLATAAPEDKRPRILTQPGVFATMGGEYVAGAGGEGGPLVYAIAGSEVTNDDCLAEPVPCVYRSWGRAQRVAARSLVRIPGAPVPAALDASGGQVAVAPAARRWSQQKRTLVAQLSGVPAALNGTVQIRDTRTGAIQATFAPRGRVLDLALARNVAAALVASGSTLRIERYSATSGRLLGALRVPDTAQDVDVAGGTVVYRVALEIRVFAAGRTTLVARVSSAPFGHSFVGRRMAWGENSGGRGRITSVTLPR